MDKPATTTPKPRKTTKKKATLATGTAPRRARLDESEIGAARAVGHFWDRHLHYPPGAFFVHAKFGVACVLETQQTLIVCLFEDGQTRKLIHGRS